jgi:hypothetical protein
MRSAFFHEDDYCQVELLPAAVHSYCLHEMGRIDEFAAAHRDGLGFTDVYIRGESPVSLASLGVTLADLHSTVGAYLVPFDQIFTGYGSHREPCRSIRAWDLDNSAAIFAGVGEADLVESLWLSLYGVPADRIGEWCRTLVSLPRSSEMVLADWNSSEVVLLADEPALAAYLRGDHA